MKHPSHTTSLYGQTQVQDYLIKAVTNNTLPHALIFSGAKGIGKATCAYHLACSIFNNDINMMRTIPSDNAVYKHMMAGTHGDFSVLENNQDDQSKKSVINVDQVRHLIAFTTKTAIQGGWRIIIIDSIDEMNHQALNALLKRLEEPPARCLFILIHHYQQNIPATIFSRCQQLTFQPLNQIDLTKVLSDQNVALSHHNMDAISQIAQGSVARAWRLIKFKGDHINDQIQNIIVELSKDQWQPCLTFINNFLSPSKEHALEDKLYLLGDLLCFNLAQALQATEPNTILSFDSNIFKNYSQDRLIDAWQKIYNLYRDFEYLSLDYYQVVVSSFNIIYQLFKYTSDLLATSSKPILGK